ncbi:MAG: hypothetical protein ACU833_14880 [Gammaproteobacteria bacterium]
MKIKYPEEEGIQIHWTHVLILNLFWLMILALPVSAQALKDCSSEESGDRIKCRTENLMNQQGSIIENLSVFEPEDREFLMRGQMRSQNATVRGKSSEYRQMTKKPPDEVECAIAQCDPDAFPACDQNKVDDDPICDKGEECAEVIGDQIGDDDGVCKARGKGNGPNREVCVQLCDFQDVGLIDDNFDDEVVEVAAVEAAAGPPPRGTDIDEALVDITSQLSRVQNEMEQPEVRVAVADPCLAMLRARPFSENALLAVHLAATTASQFDQTVAPALDQDALGWNGATGRVALGAANSTANALATNFELLDDFVTGTHVDNAYDCIQDVYTLVKANGNKLDLLLADMIIVKQRLVEIIMLLNTPTGQRPEFPLK